MEKKSRRRFSSQRLANGIRKKGEKSEKEDKEGKGF